MTMTLIETKTLLSNAVTIEFTDIPQDGTDLQVLVSARGDGNEASSGHIFFLGFNGSTANFAWRNLEGRGSTVASSNAPNAVVTYITPNDFTANTFSNNSLYIPNYTGSTYKSVSQDGVAENNATSTFMAIQALLWSQTAAITSLKVVCGSTFLTGTTVSLYKITKGSDGIVTVS